MNLQTSRYRFLVAALAVGAQDGTPRAVDRSPEAGEAAQRPVHRPQRRDVDPCRAACQEPASQGAVVVRAGQEPTHDEHRRPVHAFDHGSEASIRPAPGRHPASLFLHTAYAAPEPRDPPGAIFA